MLKKGAKVLKKGAKLLKKGAKLLKKGAKLLKNGAKLLKKSAEIFLPLNSRRFLKFILMYFQRLFYEYGRVYVSKIKDSQKIYINHIKLYF